MRYLCRISYTDNSGNLKNKYIKVYAENDKDATNEVFNVISADFETYKNLIDIRVTWQD